MTSLAYDTPGSAAPAAISGDIGSSPTTTIIDHPYLIGTVENPNLEGTVTTP